MARTRSSKLRNPEINQAAFEDEYVVLDFETVGQDKQAALNAERGSIIQAAAITYKGYGKDRQEVSRQNWLVQPSAENEAYLDRNISGIKREDYRGEPGDPDRNWVYQEELTQQLGNFIGNKMVVAHNAPFERSWLDQLGVAQNNPMLDTLDLAKTHVIKHGQAARKGFSLDTLRQTLNLPGAGGEAHTAMEDVETTAQLLDTLHGQIGSGARKGGFKSYTPKAAQANPQNSSIAFIQHVASQAQSQLQPNLTNAPAKEPVKPAIPLVANAPKKSTRPQGPNLWTERPGTTGGNAAYQGNYQAQAPIPRARPSRVGQSTLNAAQIQERLQAGWQGLQDRGYESMAGYEPDRYTLNWNGDVPAADAQPQRYGPVAGSYGLHVTSPDLYPESRGLFMQVKGSFPTGHDKEGQERALSIMTEGGAEYSVGSLLRVNATGSKKTGDLRVRTERLSPEEHLALLVENSL